MKDVRELLERLSNANDSRQFKQMLSAYNTNYKRNLEVLGSLRMIERIWVIGRRLR